mmetsp:Transcript_2995/g.5722  ORF Transcript_2995/g.5722 Transcript_2995/m.5722 type:complete len:313 (-) Transcript_2995:1663-2601(-)|eukprot:CAMPEP_0184526778 /NCGR_PEP_ID=MMETSP0198_2-20121128/10840_1 /TAXON_ID=1112570 /ORGANISM="Thraustochytrium sp., Strain LLF1b" /LENGTH=312 /DNA_ID=CAMNT_0026918381 /DNA_START=347 /DNA_END=1285 /DNA_ORIENTATION=+
MAATSEEFLELISHETTIEIDTLRDISFYGIPSEIRAKVWMVLLPTLVVQPASESDGVGSGTDEEEHGMALIGSVRETSRSSSSVEASMGFSLATAHESITDFELLRVLKSELARFQRRNALFKPTKVQTKILNIIQKYSQKGSSAWHAHHAGLVHVAAPFALLYKKEAEASYCFHLMMRAIDAHFGPQNGSKTLGRFLMHFRSHLPELFTHFEEEDVEPSQWASSWLQWLLCRELPMDCCYRLWDSYFAAPDGHGFELHSFVCLAILDNCQADLIELEQGELLSFLRYLPTLDMDRIIVQGQYLAHDFRFQ